MKLYWLWRATQCVVGGLGLVLLAQLSDQAANTPLTLALVYALALAFSGGWLWPFGVPGGGVWLGLCGAAYGMWRSWPAPMVPLGPPLLGATAFWLAVLAAGNREGYVVSKF